jgi:hypothetical protein
MPGSFSSLILPRIALLFVLGLTLGTGRTEERQNHGLVFEAWVRETFFDGYQPSKTTQKWDIPAAVNTGHGRIPVNPKAIKYRSPVDLGDALRQFDIEEPFWLVVGFWEPIGQHKHVINITAIRVQPASWRALWGDISRGDLERLDAVIKNRDLSPQEARQQVHALNALPPFSSAVIRLHPKIDTLGQRRLQCSLSFANIFRVLAPGADSGPQESPSLWGVAFPGFLE